MNQPQSDNQTATSPTSTPPGNSSSNFFSDWRVRVGLLVGTVGGLILSLFLVGFFWPHWLAGLGMRSWSSHANATPIECMMRDTNDDGYVSCSAMLKGEVVPLECGASVFNIGCRVNYGAAAAPPVRANKANGRGG
jgi:hypothetical protein